MPFPQINKNELLQIDDMHLSISFQIFMKHMKDEIVNTLELYEQKCIVCVSSNTMTKFVEELRKSHYNSFSMRSGIVQELFLLYQICNCFYYYNNNYLMMSHVDFRAKVLFPNLVYLLVRFFGKCHGFLRTIINSIYTEFKRKSYPIIQKHINSYYLDEDIIKSDILYEFLGNGLKKFDPLFLGNVNHFYKSVFRNILGFYFRKPHKYQTVYTNIFDLDKIMSAGPKTNSVELNMFRNVMYRLQGKRYCENSVISHQLSYNYSIFKNVIINNEFQTVYFSGIHNKYAIKDNKYKLLSFYKHSKDAYNTNKGKIAQIHRELQDLPTIYKLLKCVHIVNKSKQAYNNKTLHNNVIKNAVYEELAQVYYSSFNNDCVHSILKNISENFTDSILTGEYIDILSLSSVTINNLSFINQIKQFVRLCIKNH
jgi:hypothetical protein